MSTPVGSPPAEDEQFPVIESDTVQSHCFGFAPCSSSLASTSRARPPVSGKRPVGLLALALLPTSHASTSARHALPAYVCTTTMCSNTVYRGAVQIVNKVHTHPRSPLGCCRGGTREGLT